MVDSPTVARRMREMLLCFLMTGIEDGAGEVNVLPGDERRQLVVKVWEQVGAARRVGYLRMSRWPAEGSARDARGAWVVDLGAQLRGGKG